MFPFSGGRGMCRDLIATGQEKGPALRTRPFCWMGDSRSAVERLEVGGSGVFFGGGPNFSTVKLVVVGCMAPLAFFARGFLRKQAVNRKGWGGVVFVVYIRARGRIFSRANPLKGWKGTA